MQFAVPAQDRVRRDQACEFAQPATTHDPAPDGQAARDRERQRRRSNTSSSPSVSCSRVPICCMPRLRITPSEATCHGNVVAWTAVMSGCSNAHSTQARVASEAMPWPREASSMP
jgi:hypothetical protein